MAKGTQFFCHIFFSPLEKSFLIPPEKSFLIHIKMGGKSFLIYTGKSFFICLGLIWEIIFDILREIIFDLKINIIKSNVIVKLVLSARGSQTTIINVHSYVILDTRCTTCAKTTSSILKRNHFSDKCRI